MTLRWILGLVLTIASAGFVALMVIAGGFRRSFGASDKGTPFVILALVCAAVILASLVWPERRVLMHVAAVVMAAFCVGLVFLARDTASTALLGAIYAAAWFTYYYRVVWAADAAGRLQP